MKVLVVLSLLAVVNAKSFEEPLVGLTTAHGFIENIAIPLGEEIRKAEEEYANSRIVGGSPSQLGQFPYQAGTVTNFVGIDGSGVCGGSLMNANTVITAAHCWFDGIHQGSSTTVVLGSVTLFSGGNRQTTNNVIMHQNWNPTLARNDVAVIRLPNAVAFSNNISPISLPSGAEINELFVGENAIASGFGLTSDGGAISTGQFLSHVQLSVITNSVCRVTFPLHLQDSNICTSGAGGTSTCRGDSGGPLVLNRQNRRILIGITSFGSPLGCQIGRPAAFARVTSFLSFFNQFT